MSDRFCYVERAALPPFCTLSFVKLIPYGRKPEVKSLIFVIADSCRTQLERLFNPPTLWVMKKKLRLRTSRFRLPVILSPRLLFDMTFVSVGMMITVY